MDACPGYTIEKRLTAGSRGEIWLARRDTDDLAVALKRYAADRLRDGSSRARRELDALRAVAAPNVVRAIEVIEAPPVCWLALELLPGESLSSWVRAEKRSLESVLRVGIQVATALEAVHAKRWIHRDLSPANIHVEPASLDTHVTDFGSARTLGSTQRDTVSRSLSRSRGFGGGLAYASPEQTGRMGRGVDSRSDLYSAGACLYFALTRRPPFDVADPLALLHAHMARVPELAHTVDPEIPVAVSRILAKLLEKEPEQRYQSARALREDLARCLECLRSGVPIPAEMELGAADTPIRPVFRQTVYGRESELAQLAEVFTAACTASRPHVVFVCGGAGMGKSALLDALRPVVSEAGGHVAHGKFDGVRRDTAHVALRAALASLADQMLCAGEAHVVECQARLRDALGRLAGVVAEFAPGLGDVLGDTEPVPPLAAREAARRLEIALERLLRTCASPTDPLVVSLDDLQWANGDSIALLESLVCATGESSILWAFAHRPEEADCAARLRHAILERDPHACVRDIELGPLGPDAVAQMIADALGTTPESVAPLARAALRKTDASPLLVQEFVLHLHAEGRIRIGPDASWIWDAAELATAAVQEGAVALMCAKLDRLPGHLRDLVPLLSCIGDEFDATWIEQLTGEPESEIETHLFELADEGLILPSSDGFRFAHQRIREACSERLSDADRARIHHRVGHQLLSTTPLDQLGLRCVEISMHLQRGGELLTAEQRWPALAIHLAAGERTLAGGAPRTASSHLAAARALLRDEDWGREPARAFALLHESVEAALLCGELEEARRLAEILVRQPSEGFNRCRALAKRIRVLAALDDEHIEDEVILAVREFGVRWRRRRPALWGWLQVRWLDWCLRGPLDERCFKNPTGTDFSWAFSSLITHEAAPVLISRNSQLITTSILNALRNFQRYGALRSPALLLAGYGPTRIEVYGHWRGLDRLAEAALQWADKSDDTINLIAKVSLHSFSFVWLRPRRGLAEPLRELMKSLEERGDLQFAGAALIGWLAISALVAQPLPELLARLEHAHRWQAWPRFSSFARCYARAYRTLASAEGADTDWDQHSAELGPDLDELQIHGRIHWLLVLAMFERFDRVAPYLTPERNPTPMRGAIALPELQLLRGLHAAANATQLGGKAARRSRRELTRAARWLRARSKHAPDCAPLAAFLEAELASLSRATPEVLRRYAHAAKLAHDSGFKQHEAWIQERAGRYLIRVRRQLQAVPMLRQSMDLYSAWGAAAKVAHVEQLVRSINRG